MGFAVAYTPCEWCPYKESGERCGMCELAFRRKEWIIMRKEWISVEERLPEKEGKYIICTDRGYVTFGFFGNYDGNGNLTILRNNPRFDYRNVIYWMPLPEPPKGD